MAERLIRLPEVMRRVPFSRSSIYAKVALGTFPAPLSLGGRAVAWRESDLDAWIARLQPAAEARMTSAPSLLRNVEHCSEHCTRQCSEHTQTLHNVQNPRCERGLGEPS